MIRHLGRIPFRAEAVERRNTGELLPDLIASKHDRTRDGTKGGREAESQCRLARPGEAADRNDARPRRM